MKKTATITTGTMGALAVLTLGLATPAAVSTLQAQGTHTFAAQSINAPLDEERFSDLGVLGHRGPRDGVKRPGFGGGVDRPVFGPSAEGR
ncbi:hypothetical protein [Mycolicibacterium confluentis]|uniref:Uncharacterized protein n=1 Tax=Mycolicibacterium confluentis TaxID=28047 RepID=A0A7I7XRY1_9MYCO|nr:hypothetical protein [Mycolicibacterium confluentis]MCV7318816.1 hypothetical protein [Mycolicibacterium confluentis]ORV23072.1 hypothetical protein AWB99_24430 [Mycolicibacterium confluentis]BBZ31968.1 hypothetical protein MCNF_05730 [Mycolicibacterium confluentis]